MAANTGSAMLAVTLLLALASTGLCRQPTQTGQQAALHPPPPTPPTFPDSYEVSYTFSMPYFLLLQPQGFSYPVHVWVDKEQDSVRIDINDGKQQAYFLQTDEFVVAPQKYTRACNKYKHGGGPIRAVPGAAGPSLGAPVLPSLEGWQHYGSATFNDQQADMWQLKSMQGEKVNTYTFYVSKEGAPLRLHSVGQDLLGGSHYDEYIYEFTSFKAGAVDAKVFELPDLCEKEKGMQELVALTASSSKAVALLPGAHQQHKDEAHFQAWSALHTRDHTSEADYNTRLAAFLATRDRVAAHNSQMKAAKGAITREGGKGDRGASYSLELNQFADWSREEFERVMLPNKWRRDHGLRIGKVRGHPSGTFQKTLTRHQLPRELDWRATPGDFAVKDQGQCGSCWAFAGTGTMEGAWYTATGQARSFSEQQLIDCAWDQGPHGCDGGDYQPGFDYVAQAGGIASTGDYPYVGQNDFCRDNITSKSGHFTGYVEVPQDEEAVMEALWKHGPLAVGVDASYDGFNFYSEGVYHDRRCSMKPRNLDHAVLLVGYGTDEETDQDYWIIRNSWSKFWGDDGYIKIYRGGNDCGIASDAAFAQVPKEYEVPGMRAKIMAQVAQLSAERAAERRDAYERRQALVKPATA